MSAGLSFVADLVEAELAFANEDARLATIKANRIDSALPKLDQALKILADRKITDVAHLILDIKSILEGVSEQGEAG